MARRARPWRKPWKRGDYYYARLAGWSGWKSTGCTSLSDAEKWCIEAHNARRKYTPRPIRDDATLAEFLARYFVWDKCPHIRDLLDEGKRIGKPYAAQCRKLIEKHILTHPIAQRPVNALRNGEVKDFRSDLVAKLEGHKRTVNITMTILKICLRDGVQRQDITNNPAAGVGRLSYAVRKPKRFSAEVLDKLFADKPGVWEDETRYAFFYTLSRTGMRKGEALTVCWKDVDFDKRIITLRQTLKPDNTVGPLKCRSAEDKREVPMGPALAQLLRDYRGLRVDPEGFVFADARGLHHTASWATKSFYTALGAIGIDRKTAGLKIHGFRHLANTTALEGGVGAEKIRATMGWSDPSIQAGYTAISGAGSHEVADAIEKALRGT